MILQVIKVAKKTFFAILATEVTIENTVADLGIVICDREGRLHNQCAILVAGHYDSLELFCDENLCGTLRTECLEARRIKYEEMIDLGVRIVTSVSAINKWINQAIIKYDPILTAYGMDINSARCWNTGIDISGFSEKFCFRDAIIGNVQNTEKYIKFAVENDLEYKSREHFAMNSGDAIENVYWFLSGRRKFIYHTALEDARDFQIPILSAILEKRDWKRRMVGSE
jgi:hypothetical protein